MKKYLKLLPLIIYPYAYIIFLILMIASSNLYDSIFGDKAIIESSSPIGSYIIYGITILYNAYVLFLAIYNSRCSVTKYTASEAAKINLTVKCCQIPAYIFHFILGIIGICMSIWGIGLIMVSVIVNFLSIILTGINSIGCTVKMRKDGNISTIGAFFMGIGCFMYVIDIVVAFAYIAISKHKKISENK